MILVTGVSGFIGKHLFKELKVVFGSKNVLALTSKPTNCGNFLLHNNYNFKNSFFVESGYTEIDTIIHAGAYIPKDRNEKNIVGCNENIRTSMKLLSCELPKLKKFILLSTVDVYKADEVISEESSLQPSSLYSASKLYCEHLVKNWSTNNRITCQILRIGHVYGPGEELYQKIIPITIDRLLKNEPVKLIGNPKTVRSFIFIKDVIDAIIQSIYLKNSEDCINLVSDQPIEVERLIKLMISISGRDSKLTYEDNRDITRNLIFNNSKMKKMLITPSINLKDGLREEWEYMNSKLSS